jgi:hypothetical protein
MAKRNCSVEDCPRVAVARGWCAKHYLQWKRTGDPVPRLIRPNAKDNPVAWLWAHVDRKSPDECWPWTKGAYTKGYGRIHVYDKWVRVHRYVYTLAVGPIPDGYVIDHQCHDPLKCSGGDTCPHRLCCNPAHLEAVPPAINNSSARSAANRGVSTGIATHCGKGHEFTPENTYLHPNGERRCRACQRAGERRRYAIKKEALAA